MKFCDETETRKNFEDLNTKKIPQMVKKHKSLCSQKSVGNAKKVGIRTLLTRKNI